MKSLIFLFSVVAFASAQLFLDPGTQVINGVDAERNEFPWQLSYQLNGLHSCGAVLVGADTVLIAAHCIIGDPQNYTVVAGMHNRLELEDELELTAQVRQVVNATRHPDFGPGPGEGSYANDVGFVLVDPPFDLDHDSRWPIDLPHPFQDFEDDDCWISGWGRIHANISQQLANTLQKANMPVIDNDWCQELMDPVAGAEIIDSHICVFDDYAGACSGDSGGPLHCRENENSQHYTLAGLTSFGVVSLFQGCQTSFPSVYTRVSEHLDWICDNIDVPGC